MHECDGRQTDRQEDATKKCVSCYICRITCTGAIPRKKQKCAPTARTVLDYTALNQKDTQRVQTFGRYLIGNPDYDPQHQQNLVTYRLELM